MKCYKCGKEADLKRGLCIECYRELLTKKNIKQKKKSLNGVNYILSNLDRDEKIISRIKTSNLAYAFIIALLAIAVILFPRTILEFFFKNNKMYFLILVANILIFFLSIYLTLYFLNREICLTNKRIFGKWGLFKLKTLDISLNKVESIDTFQYKAVEIDIPDKIYVFDFVSNAENFKVSTITQIKILIDSTKDENILQTFSHSLNKKFEEYKLEEKYPNMIYCKCCKKRISKESTFCVHCGQPVAENEREADFFLKLICFLFPPFGIIIFLLNIGEYPKFSKQCLISSILSIFAVAVIYISVKSVM